MQEIITNHFDPSNKSGQIRHRFVNPETHWDSVVEINVNFINGKVRHIDLNYGCGGWKEGVTQPNVANAMSRAFQLAGARLEQLYKEHDYEGS